VSDDRRNLSVSNLNKLCDAGYCVSDNDLSRFTPVLKGSRLSAHTS
jgi:hypothetical protein